MHITHERDIQYVRGGSLTISAMSVDSVDVTADATVWSHGCARRNDSGGHSVKFMRVWDSSGSHVLIAVQVLEKRLDDGIGVEFRRNPALSAGIQTRLNPLPERVQAGDQSARLLYRLDVQVVNCSDLELVQIGISVRNRVPLKTRRR